MFTLAAICIWDLYVPVQVAVTQHHGHSYVGCHIHGMNGNELSSMVVHS